jgi:hypothetical protein
MTQLGKILGRAKAGLKLTLLLCLFGGTVMAQEPKVTELLSKDLKDNPGKEVLMISVEYPPGGADPIHRHNAAAFVYVLEVIADPHARYFGTELSERSLVPGNDAQLGETRFEDWLSRSTSQAPPPTPRPATASINASTRKENEFRVSEVPPGSALVVGEAAVFNVGGTFCATQEKCTHRQGPLSSGS